jgi:hypothetical protein
MFKGMVTLYKAVKGDDYEGETRNMKKVIGALELGILEATLDEEDSSEIFLCQKVFPCDDDRQTKVLTKL